MDFNEKVLKDKGVIAADSSLGRLGMLSLLSNVCEQSGFKALDFQARMRKFWPFSQDGMSRIIAPVSPTRRAYVTATAVSDHDLASGPSFEQANENSCDSFAVSDSDLALLQKKYPAVTFLEEVTASELDSLFTRRELEEFLELDDDHDDFMNTTGTKSDFSRSLLTFHRTMDARLSVSSCGAFLTADPEGHYRHHCNVCKTQYTTKASCDRHLVRMSKNRDRVHVTAAKKFEEQFSDVGGEAGEHSFRDMYGSFPVSIRCNPLKCSLLHLRMKNAARTAPKKKLELDSEEKSDGGPSARRSQRVSLVDKQEKRYHSLLSRKTMK